MRSKSVRLHPDRRVGFLCRRRARFAQVVMVDDDKTPSPVVLFFASLFSFGGGARALARVGAREWTDRAGAFRKRKAQSP